MGRDRYIYIYIYRERERERERERDRERETDRQTDIETARHKGCVGRDRKRGGERQNRQG